MDGTADKRRYLIFPNFLRRLTMTAALAPYEDLVAFDDALLEATAETLDEDSFLQLLLLRFRAFASCGYDPSRALLRAVGFADGDLALALAAARGFAATPLEA
jgi:hypothetical protein